MPLGIRIPQPHFDVDPFILSVIRSPNWIVVACQLVKLNGYGHNISVTPDVKQAYCWACISSLKAAVQGAVLRNVMKDFVVHQINAAFLLIM